MVRSAFIVACVLLVGACGKDVEDPGFTATAGGSMTAGGSTSSGGGEESTSTSGASNTGNSNSNSDTNSTTQTTAPADSGSSDTAPSEESGPAGCGDGMISPGEQCDGSDLQGFDCSSLGLNGGTLSCDPVTCTFDTSMCMSTSGGTSG